MAEGDRSQPPLPKVIGRYQIQASLGAGAMGAVYKGFDPLIKRTLAIKTIRLDIHRASEEYKNFLERFYQEARISGTLSHPNIITLFDIGEDAGLPFLALEFIEGETIESMLARGVKFRPEKVIGLVSQVASAIDYAHSKGVIHRDIKPANLMVYEEDRIKVADFGIAKLADSEMTKVGQLLGTPSYMSPEQAMGEKLDGRSDIFSLGVCAFEMLCGQQPFPGTNVTAILYRLVHTEPIRPENLEMNGLIPEKWHEVFPKVLSKSREDRYQTAAEFVRDLEYCLGTWFTGLGEDLVPAVPPPSISATPAAAAASALPAPAASPPPAASSPAGLHARNADDPSVVVSMDELQSYIAPTGARPTGPAIPEDDDIPQTVAMKPGEIPKGDSLPPTLSVPRPGTPAASDEDLPPTVSVPRPPARQEKTVLLSTPASKPPSAPASDPPRIPSSMPAAKPASVPPFRLGSVPTYKPPIPLASRSHPPRMPGPSSRPPSQRSIPPPAEVPETETSPQPRAGLPIGLIAGGVATLVAVGVVAWLMTRGPIGSSPSPTSEPTRSAGTGVIAVQTTPSGATLKLNDEARGTSPASLTGLAPGSYEVVAELKGYEPQAQRVSLDAGSASAQVKLTLQPSKSAMSDADILSRPAGATVLMDGQRIGQTPLRGQKLRVGNRRFRLTTEGYEPYTEFLTVEEGKTARLDARMVPLGAAPPPAAAASPKATPPAATAPPAAAAKPIPGTPPPLAAVAAPAESAPTTTAPAPPARPTVDTARVYTESEVDSPPRKLSGDKPNPSIELKSGEKRSVKVVFVVSDSGDVTDIQVVESGGKAIDDAVIQTLRKWKYAPGTQRGVKVKVSLEHRFRFESG